MDHLACFVPGMLALGVESGAVVDAPRRVQYVDVAANLTHTCWQMYNRQPTGLSSEFVSFDQKGMRTGARHNLQRPEAIEAFWYMWRLTRDWRYRAWGWEVFRAMQAHCLVPGVGYSGIRDVTILPPKQDDTQQSFFLAETLKYLWLLLSDDSALDTAAVVLNTEAHPLRVQKRVLPGWRGEGAAAAS